MIELIVRKHVSEFYNSATVLELRRPV